MRRIVITGCNSGLGLEICASLSKFGINDSQTFVIGIDKDQMSNSFDIDQYIQCDLTQPDQIAATGRSILGIEEPGEFASQHVDILINCAGVNGIDWLPDLHLEMWDEVMNVNARAIFLLTQALLPGLGAAKGTVLNIISNASHMPMTNSLAYNASKGAAHIMTLQLARELSKSHQITVFGVSPNKLSGTKMSRYIESQVPAMRGWTPEQAKAYQLQSLIAGEETKPEVVAEFIAFLLQDKEHHKFLAGCVIPYGA